MPTANTSQTDDGEQPAVLASAPGAAAGEHAPRIIALMNQKGGVGKTTTTVNLGAALASLGHRVLLIDLDPQAHLTLHVGVDPDGVDLSMYDLLTNEQVSARQVLRKAGKNLWLLPAEVNLAGVETELAPLALGGQAQRILAEKLRPLLVAASNGRSAKAGRYDIVLIDCPPSLGLLTVNALAAATEVLVPMQAHFLALQGLSKLLETVSHIQRSINPRLAVAGIVPCMHEGQTLLASEVMADLRTFFDAARNLDVPWRNARVLEPAIRRNIKLAECPSFGKTILEYAPECNGAHDYQQLAQNVLALHAPSQAAAAVSQARPQAAAAPAVAAPA